MPVDHERINKFLEQSSFKSAVGSLLRKTGFEIRWIKEGKSAHTWGLYLKPNQPLRDLWSVNQEILMWVVDFDEYSPKTISQAVEIIIEERPRLSEQLVFIVTCDPRTGDKVKNSSSQIVQVCVGFSEDEILEHNSNASKSFLQAIQSRSFASDPYWKSTPIESPRFFFGRREQLDEIASSLVNKHLHIGLFGLRKMGKTSFLYRLLEMLQQRFSCHISYLDIELIDAVNPSAEYFLWSVGNAILQSVGKNKPKDLQLLGKWQSFAAIENTSSVVELFVHDVNLILSQTKNVIVVAFDEIDLMAPPEIMENSNWSSNNFIRIWRILRGLAQQNPGKISFFITGTNPKFIEANRIGGVDNPIYNFFRKDYLKPLLGEASLQLLKETGSLVGLDWSDEAMKLVHKRVGGHPLLLRAYGSIIHNAKLPRNAKVKVEIEDVIDEAPNFMRKVNPQLSQMLDVISDYYQNEYTLLEMLATGRIGEFREFARAFPEETEHLVGYGLIEYTVSRCEVSVEPLQTWMQRKQSSSQIKIQLIDNGDNDPIIGMDLDDYKVETSIGHAGGYSKVYRAKQNVEDKTVAIKVLRNGLLSILQREVDILRDLNHPNIVRLINSGKTQNGIVYLVMEYLEGDSLRSFCDRTSRLAPEKVTLIAKELLSALAYMHPNYELMNKLETKKELSSFEFAELERARHGKIHRDIKPENIIFTKERGSVLIDFNISVRASDPIVTQSHTYGYLPLDMEPGKWTTDVDLYQLGITLAQIATGIEYQSDADGDNNLSDIREQVKTEIPNKLKGVILKLCSARRGQRFASAKEALNRLA